MACSDNVGAYTVIPDEALARVNSLYLCGKRGGLLSFSISRNGKLYRIHNGCAQYRQYDMHDFTLSL